MDTRDDQFFALPEETTQLEYGLGVDYLRNPDMFYEYGVIASGQINGVFGQAGSGDGRGFRLRGGVVGWSQQQPGVLGWSRNNNGVDAESVGGPGLSAVSFWGPGVNAVSGTIGVRALGQSAGISGKGLEGSGVVGASGPGGAQFFDPFTGSGVVGMSGAAGPSLPAPYTGPGGAVGTSDLRPGVIGTSSALMGVYGYSSNSVGVYGQTANPTSYAGVFVGNLLVTGQILAGVKNAIVSFPDGSKRLLHCMESPEHWFEDFGAAKLKRGRAVVKLDADFGKVIKRGDYRVFLTPEGDCRGLYVRRKSASFEVRELQGGVSDIRFSYRIVGKRKDISGHQRFAKFDPRASMPVARARPARRVQPARRAKIPRPTPDGLRAFAARMEKEAGVPMPQRGRKRKG
jgi:hypothetical protein